MFEYQLQRNILKEKAFGCAQTVDSLSFSTLVIELVRLKNLAIGKTNKLNRRPSTLRPNCDLESIRAL
jgi:hypothetical protein